MKHIIILVFCVIIYSACDNKSANSIDFGESSSRFQFFDLNNNEGLDFRTPFFWGYNKNTIKSTFKDSTIFKEFHPLDIGRQAYYSLYYGEKLNDSTLLNIGAEYLNYLKNYKFKIDTGEITTYAYGFDHREFEKGNWWSGMANSTIALGFYKGYQIFRDSTFLNEYKRVSKSLNLPTSQGGCLVSTNNSHWCLEYTSFKTNDENAYYVLNGFLYSLVAIKQLAIISNDDKLDDLFNSGKKAFIKMSERFYYKDNSWTYYMLNPKTIESTHYAIYDIMLFSSLYKIDKDNCWKNEIERRSRIILNHFPIDKISDSSLFFSVLGPPHPYWIDTYPVSIVFNFGKSYKDTVEIKNTKEFTIPTDVRVFHSIRFSNLDSLESVDYYVNYSGSSFYIGSVSGDSFIDKIVDTSNLELNSFKEYSNVERSEEGGFIAKNDSADLNAHTVHLNLENKDFTKYKYFGFKVNLNFRPRSVRILLIDKNGNSAERYYPTLKYDTTNLILLHHAGFKRVEKIDLSNLNEIRLMLYTSKHVSESRLFKTSRLYAFPTNYSVKRLFDDEDFYFPEKKSIGNIY